MRSTSDVSEMIHEIARKRDNKEKRSKPYKSDPFGSSGRRRNLREATLMKGTYHFSDRSLYPLYFILGNFLVRKDLICDFYRI